MAASDDNEVALAAIEDGDGVEGGARTVHLVDFGLAVPGPKEGGQSDDDDAGIAATRFTPRSPRHAPGVASPSRRHIAIFFEKY